jgi:trimeric autotransporter adhesin
MKARLILLSIICSFISAPSFEQIKVSGFPRAGEIFTIAGTGARGKGTNNKRAMEAQFDRPTGVSDDFFQNTYIADNANHIVWKVDMNGVMTIFAGTGKKGYSGDHGKASSADLFEPNDVKTDNAGNVYIVDQGNNVIRKVDRRDNITTIAGTGSPGFSGDGGQATNASLYIPTSLAIDQEGNIFIADAGNERIRKIDTAGIIRTYAGNGEKGYRGDGKQATKAAIAYVNGIAVDRKGNLYFAQKDSHVIRIVSKSGKIYTFAGTGIKGYSGDGNKALDAELNCPYGLTVALNGDVYFADNGNGRIRKIDEKGIITTVAGCGKARNFTSKNGLKTSFISLAFINMSRDGSLLIADRGANRVRKLLICPDVPTDIFPKVSISVGKTLQIPFILTGGGWSSDSPLISISPEGYLRAIAPGEAILMYEGGEMRGCDLQVSAMMITVSPKK